MKDDWYGIDKEMLGILQREAVQELHQERHQAYKEHYKNYLRTKRTFWNRIFPFRIHIERIKP